ncbi:MAG: potassium channel family protein [Candidatus Omnitrophica bacterium]|nr:potassium channel family protein [Candidatus Omnitrophota bacterium]
MEEKKKISDVTVVLKRIILLVAILFVVIFSGTLGYFLIEGWSLQDAFYMTAITISTVGFGEVGRLSFSGRLFTVILIFIGITLFGSWTAVITSFLVEADLKNYFRRKKMFDKIKNMKDHTILCGSGSTGMAIIEEFTKANKDLVLIEHNREHIRKIEDKFPKVPIIEANATAEESLWIANIKSAGVLISALSTDVDNLYVVITARDLNPNLFIVARSFDDNIAHRIYKAGANEVIFPNKIGGQRMASICLERKN